MEKTIAVITGATGGLGSEFVKLVCAEPVDEVWAIARNCDKLEMLKNKYGNKMITVSADLSDNSSYEFIKQKLLSEKPHIAYLINNAGGGKMDPSVSFPAEYIEKSVSTHCTAVAVLCNICIPYMRKGDHIINMASQSAFQPVPYINLYAASKAFVRSYSRALNMELKERGIDVTCACPGWVKTELLEKERNGHEIRFPGMAQAEAVAKKTFYDAKRGKDMSVYGAYVRYMHFLTKIFPQKAVMKTWLRSIKKYI